MEENLGSLGNVEIYIVLKKDKIDLINSLINQTPLRLLDIHLNNWVQGISQQCNADFQFSNQELNKDEEIVFRFQLGSNIVSLILMCNRAVIYVHFRAWDKLETQM